MISSNVAGASFGDEPDDDDDTDITEAVPSESLPDRFFNNLRILYWSAQGTKIADCTIQALGFRGGKAHTRSVAQPQK